MPSPRQQIASIVAQWRRRQGPVLERARGLRLAIQDDLAHGAPAEEGAEMLAALDQAVPELAAEAG